MPYCSKCGVKVEVEVKQCPLCDFELPRIKDEELKEERYPFQENVFGSIAKRRKNIFMAIYSVIAIAVCINLFFIDYSNGNLSWSIYANIYIFGSIVYMFVFLGYIKNILKSMIVAVLNTCIVLFFNDIVNGQMDWFFMLALPIILEAGIYIYFSILMFMSRIILPYRIMNFLFFTSVFLVNLEVLINNFLYDVFKISWSFYAAIYFIPLILIIIFIPRKKYEELASFLERKFHI